MNKIVVAVDAMGGDNAPDEIVKGCIEALNEKDIEIIILGDEELINKQLEKYNYNKSAISVLHTSQVIATDETPTIAIKSKKDSSIVRGLQLVKEGKVSAFVSAGNTGALLTGATIIVGRIKGIERPALASALPNKNGFSLLLDAGANVDAKPSYLLQFAKMGAIYMESVMGVENPKVGLINIGAEKEKGNALTKEAYELLENSNVNFVGNVEPRDACEGVVDVMVCDAFVGNVMLKFAEGLAGTLIGIVKEEIMLGFFSKLGALLCIKAFKRIKKRVDYAEVGGMPFLGLKGLVVKAHGSSNSKAIKNAIFNGCKFAENNFNERLQESL